MVEEMRRILDQLMGKDRDKLPAERKRANAQINLADRKLCPYYLVDYCPHELFTNTKSDLGPCDREHDEKAKQAWNALSLKEQWSYGHHTEFKHFCDKLISQMDLKIRRGERRAEEVSAPDPAAANVDSATKAAQTEQIDSIERRIQELMAEMDKLAEQGEVDAIDGMVDKVERLKIEKEELLRASGQGGQANKAMRVCEICGAFLVAGDSEKRIQAHLEGKQHIGFWQLRQSSKKIDELKAEVAELRRKREDDDKKEKKRSRSRSRSRERHRSSRTSRTSKRSRSRSRSKDRKKDKKDKKKRSKSRSASKERDKKSEAAVEPGEVR